MIQIILQILSIIGIVLLVLLGLLLLILLVVLFVPVRYAVRASKDEKVFLTLKVHWLLHLLTVRFDYPENGAVRVKIAGITIYDSKKPKKEKKKKKSEKAETDQEVEEKIEETIEETEEKNTETSEKLLETDTDSHDFPKKKNIFQKIKEIFQKIIAFFRKLKYTITHFCDTIKNVKDNYEYYKAVLQDEKTLALLKNGKTRLFKVLKRVRPKKLEADILFGTGSPDTTGYALGLYGMVLPYLGNHVTVTPDFETAVLKGRIFAKGRIRVMTVLINALHILCDPNLKPVIKKLKREA